MLKKIGKYLYERLKIRERIAFVAIQEVEKRFERIDKVKSENAFIEWETAVLNDQQKLVKRLTYKSKLICYTDSRFSELIYTLDFELSELTLFKILFEASSHFP